MAAKKHHYVPVFYQRGFGDDDLMLWRYDRRRGEYNYLSPKVMCREEDLYAVKASDGSTDRRIETNVLSPIETGAAPIIRALGPGVILDRRELGILVRFVALQHTRLPSFGRAVRRVAESVNDEWARMRFGTLERAEEALARLRQAGETVGSDAASMVDAVLSKRVLAHANNSVFIEHMFDIASTLGRHLLECDWAILAAPLASGFVVCDDPFVPVPPRDAEVRGVGFGTPGVTCYFPLNKWLCLKATHGGYIFRYEQIDSRAVRIINHNIAAHSERFVMASTRGQLEAVVLRSRSTTMEPQERYSVQTIRPDDNALTEIRINPGRYFYD